jgi:anaerobic magnesium-protoporphyrin IX monomethyl ester cyclase
MRIAFIVAEDESLGVGYLSSLLKEKGHEVFLVFDPKQFDRAYLRSRFLSKFFSRQEENLKKIGKIKPDLIGFSCVTANYQWALNFSKKIKNNYRHIPIIFGGVHPTLVPELTIKEKSVDMVCIGEGEEALLELADNFDKNKINIRIKNIWFKKDKKIIRNSLRVLVENLDKYPAPDKGLFYEQLPNSYRLNTSYLSSRGCPFNCTFCGNQQKREIYKGLGTYIRQKNVENVVEELVDFKNKFGTKHILFGDDIFAINKNWLKKFTKLFRKKVGLTFSCFVHPQILDLEQAKLLKKAGCTYVWFGIQSGSEEIRKKILNRFEKNEDIARAAKICHQVGLNFMVDHIFDIPFESDKEILEAIKLYNQIRPSMINCYNLLYFPCARIIDYGLKSGNLTKNDVEKINQGKEIVYQTGALIKTGSQSRDFYRRYALLLVSIPLLPNWLVKIIYQNQKAINFFGQLPLFLIPLAKITLDLKTGFGFIPLAVIKTEIFFTYQFFLQKFKNIFSSN